MSDHVDQPPPLALESVACCICGSIDASVPIAVGEDFEYRVSRDQFVMFRCRRCDVIYLNPRPARSELGRLYGDDYHAYDFSEERFGLAYRVRATLETRRLASWTHQLPHDARVIDIGAGDGFHLELLKTLGSGWDLEAIEPDHRAAQMLRERGFRVHEGFVDQLSFESGSYDFAMMIMVLEHVDDPLRLLEQSYRLLKPGGRLGIVTDNIGSPDAMIARSRHWGGYHFPRHFNLFSRRSLTTLAFSAGFQVTSMTTMMSPVNWTYSVRNFLDDWGAPTWLVNRFSLKSPGALGFFSLLDSALRPFHRGALLRAVLTKP